MKIEKKFLKDLKPAEYNPRKANAKQEGHLKASLEKFGVVEPVIVNCNKDRENIIVGGHFRVRELKKLGYKEVDCVIVDLSLEDEKELNIRLNANTGDFDWDLLANNFDLEELNEWGLEVPDMEVEELEAKEDDFDAEPPVNPKTVLGDLYEIGEHRLLCGDSTCSDAVAKLMDEKKADMVFTDPPYGVNYSGRGKNTTNTIENDNLSLQETEEMVFGALTNAFIFSREGATIFVWHADSKPGLRPLFEKAFLESGWGLRATIIWQKKQASMGYADYRSQHEPCLYGWKGVKKERLEDRTQTTLWEGGRDQNYVHPTQKPLFLCETAIKNHNLKLLIDLFLGSGSTMVASHQLKRKCYGMELDPKYCDVIVKRMIKLDPSLKITRNGEDCKNEFIENNG